VGPEGDVDEADVLEYAKALIEEYGWRQGSSNVRLDDMPASGVGFTLHDALGYAAERFTDITGEKPREQMATGNKSFTRQSDRRELRNSTMNLISRLTGGDDKTFNDAAASVQEVYDLIDRGIEEVRSGSSV